jgi:hypothetical protein
MSNGRYMVSFPGKFSNAKTKAFKTIDDALNFVCSKPEMISSIHPLIYDYIVQNNHRILNVKNLELC